MSAKFIVKSSEFLGFVNCGWYGKRAKRSPWIKVAACDTREEALAYVEKFKSIGMRSFSIWHRGRKLEVT